MVSTVFGVCSLVMRNFLSRPGVFTLLSLLALVQFAIFLFLLPLDIPRLVKAQGIWGQWVRIIWEAPMLRDALLFSMGGTVILLVVCLSLWIENRWEGLKKLPRNYRASSYLQRSSVRRDIHNLREVILR